MIEKNKITKNKKDFVKPPKEIPIPKKVHKNSNCQYITNL